MEEKERVCAELLEMMRGGVVTPLCGTVYPLGEVVEAIAEATKEARGGKVFLSN